jgi:hypothetical protein
MDLPQFARLIGEVTSAVGARPIDQQLESHLNQTFPSTSQTYLKIFAACRAGIADGWMCQRSAGNVRYGRVLKPSSELGQFSVDVVEMTDVIGPHHAHPKGEIDLVMPIDARARFDGHDAGWVVYGPNSAHKPTVTGGQALVLYLLPDGAIDFTRAAE